MQISQQQQKKTHSCRCPEMKRIMFDWWPLPRNEIHPGMDELHPVWKSICFPSANPLSEIPESFRFLWANYREDMYLYLPLSETSATREMTHLIDTAVCSSRLLTIASTFGMETVVICETDGRDGNSTTAFDVLQYYSHSATWDSYETFIRVEEFIAASWCSRCNCDTLLRSFFGATRRRGIRVEDQLIYLNIGIRGHIENNGSHWQRRLVYVPYVPSDRSRRIWETEIFRDVMAHSTVVKRETITGYSV